jgi:threonine/homoserine/homoserine lactone efflux protein
LIAAVVMTALGIINLLPAKESPSAFAQKFNASGFRRGLLLSVLNPMAIPYWMGFTAYLKAEGWIELPSQGLLHTYVFGTSVGVLALLFLLIQFAQRVAPHVQGSKWIKIIPGIILLSLGLYAFWRFLFL